MARQYNDEDIIRMLIEQGVLPIPDQNTPGMTVEPAPTTPAPTVPAPTTPTPSPTPGGTGTNDTTPLPSNEGPTPGNLEGFDQGKLDSKDKQTIKYRAARVFQRFSPADFVKNPQPIIDALKAAGLNPTLVGKDQIDFNDGYGPVDVVRAASLGGQAWVWQPVNDTAGSASTSGTGQADATASTDAGGTRYSITDPGLDSGSGVNEDYLAPWTQAFTAPTSASVGAMPSWEAFSPFMGIGEFQAPTAESVFADPSYQFRVSEGAKALENAAAAKGVLNSGGTLSDLLNYGQKAASQEYGNVWDREWAKYQNAWNNEASKWGMNFGANQEDYSRKLGLWDRAKSQADDSYTRAWNNYLADRDTFWTNQRNAFDKLYKTAQLGAGASV